MLYNKQKNRFAVHSFALFAFAGLALTPFAQSFAEDKVVDILPPTAQVSTYPVSQATNNTMPKTPRPPVPPTSSDQTKHWG